MESKNVTKEKENGDVTKLGAEETNNEKEKLDQVDCNHNGPHAQSHSILFPVTKVVIRPTPVQTVMIVPLDLYRGWYGGYESGYGRGYMDGVGYGSGTYDMYGSPLVHFPYRK